MEALRIVGIEAILKASLIVEPDFETILGRCSPDSFADLYWLVQNIEEHNIEWSDLRCLLVFLDTQSWFRRDDPSESEAEEASSDNSLDLNVCKCDLSPFVIKYILFDKENFIFLSVKL